MRVVLVANPGAGSADDELVACLLDALGALGPAELVRPSSPEVFAAEVRAAAAGAEAVVVAGGDGSLCHTVNALGERLGELTFGLLPMGTGNDLARTLGIGDDPYQVALGLRAGRTMTLDLGRVRSGSDGMLFVNGCLGGFPVEVDRRVSAQAKRLLGPLAFWLAGAKVAVDPPRATVRVGATEVRDCVAVGVGNGRSAGGGLPVWPRAEPDDGLLEVVALPLSGALDALVLAAKLRAGEHLELDGVVSLRCERIDVAADPPFGFNVDGELLGLTTPLTFEVGGSIRMLVPAL